MKSRGLVALVACLVTGCAVQPTTPIGPPPECTGAADCQAKWEAAQIFVVHHAGMKLQIVTDVLLETYNPSDYGAELAMRVTKEPLGGGSYRFIAEGWCNNFLGCEPSAGATVAKFNSTISAVTP